MSQDNNQEGKEALHADIADYLKDPKKYFREETKRGIEEAEAIVKSTQQTGAGPEQETSQVLATAQELKADITGILQALPAYKIALHEHGFSPDSHIPDDDLIRFTAGDYRYGVRFVQVTDDISALQIRRRAREGSLENPIEEARAERENPNYWDEDSLISDNPQKPDILHTISRAYRHRLIQKDPKFAMQPRSGISSPEAINAVQTIRSDLRAASPLSHV